MNEDELFAAYESVTAPIVSPAFFRAFPQTRYDSHATALGGTACATAKDAIRQDIATLKAIRNGLSGKLRELPYYASVQAGHLEDRRMKAEFTNAPQKVDKTDPVTRATAGFLQWPLSESMTAPMASLAIGFGLIGIAATAGSIASGRPSPITSAPTTPFAFF